MPKKKNSKEQSPSLPFRNVAEVSFLGWEQPILHSAVDYLAKRYSRGNSWDMDHVLVVLPGSMAGRRIQVLMAHRAAEQKLVLRPPRFLTLGKLPEELYHAKLPFASELTQIMAWVQVLRSTPANELQPLLFEVPTLDQLGVWMDLAKLLGSLHKELASDLLDFKDVAEKLTGTIEEPRWKILAQLQRRYLDVLHEAGLWDVQSARRFALEHGEVVDFKNDVVLIGTVDLNRAQRQFLAAIGPNVQVLVGAPNSFAEGFDRDGTLRSSFWQNVEIPIDQNQIHVRTSAVQAGQELAVQLAKLGKSRSVRDITIGVPDPSLVPALQETLAQHQVALRYGPGIPIYGTPPMRVLYGIEEYLRDPNVENFSNLIRIPWIESWLSVHAKITPQSGESQSQQPQNLPADFLTSIDEYLKQTLLRSVSVPKWPQASGREIFVAVVEAIDRWLQPLRSSKRTLDAWAKPLRNLFISLSELKQIDRTKPDGHVILRGCREINSVLDRLANVPPKLNLEIELTEALAWLQQQLQGVQIPPLADDSAIEMLGWLDVALDDAPVLMMTGLHDGVVPESVNSDAFLPNRLRSELGLLDNARRYARDAYVMMACLHTREQVEFIMNRYSANSDPLTPSRLMMAVQTDQLPERVAKLISDQEESSQIASGWPARELQSDIAIPKPDPSKRIGAMAVTDFKKNSECPYRFYLRKLCKAYASEHLPQELDGGGFGDMLHLVLEGLKDSPVAESTDAKTIANWLIPELDAWVENHFGSVLPPALVVQIEQAKLRLLEFAKHQAQWAAQGWKIEHIEFNVQRSNGILWKLDHGQMIIHGRIDRIDVNKQTGEIAVLDYKTGDTTEEPRRNHLKGQEWTDWQLPLYGLLIKTIKDLEIKDMSKVHFGYILLPKNVPDTKFILANFSAEEHAAAIESAKEIADRVLQGEFWPPSDKIPLDWDDYRFITQRTVLRPWDPRLEEHKASKPTTITKQESSADSRSVDPKPNAKARGAQGSIIPKMISIEPVFAEGCPLDEWFEPSMILASAGTGKTYQLASRAIRLLFTDQPLDSILATTFTRKAAGEILHRILQWLSEASSSTEGLHRLESVIAPMQIGHKHARYQLARLCTHLHRFRVSTLDSFYSQLAKSFALELKLPPGWTLLDTAQEELLIRDAITQLFDTIDHQQLRTLVTQLSKGLAVRGVRVEVENLITDAYELFRQAPEDAWAKIQVPKGPDEEQVRQAEKTIETLELQSARLKTAKDKALALFRSQKWDEFLQESIVRACLTSQPTYYKSEIDPKLVSPLRILLAKAKTEFFTIRRIQNEASHQLLKKYHQTLEKLKQNRRVVTFSDIADRLAHWMRSILQEHQESGNQGPLPQMQSITHRMDSSIDHLLLDEFQDTSPNQWQILKPFAEAIVSHKASGNKRTSFFVVGDTKQAIYAWRGGVSEILESVGQQVQNIKQQKLSESFRSSPIIMEFVNEVFHGLAKHPNYLSEDDNKRVEGTEHPVVSKWVDRYFIDHTTKRSSLPGVVEFWNAKERPQDDPSQDPDAKKTIPTDIDLDIADAVTELHRRSDQITIGILTRTNSDVAKMISLLRDRGVEASQEGGNPLIDTAPVLVVQSALKLADHSGDSLAYFHLQHSPLRSFWDEEVSADATKISLDLRQRLDTVGFGGTVSTLVDHLAPHCTLRDQERLLQLVSEAHRFDASKQSLVHEFIQRIQTTRVATQSESVVRVMTIHQSKGLEFDAVFIPAIDQPIVRQSARLVAMRDSLTGPPISIMRNVGKDLQPYLPIEWHIACQESSYQQLGEALCLFYVALTRARHALYLYATPNKSAIKQWGSALHSIFANEQTNAAPGVMIYRHGQVDWVERSSASRAEATKENPKNQKTAQEPKDKPLELQLRLENTLLRNPQWIAPSQQPKTQTLEPLVDYWKPDDTDATVIGKLIHRWFEEVRTWIDEFSPNKNELLKLAASALTKDEMMQLQLDEQANRFLRYCESDTIRQVFSKDRYAQWHQPTKLRLEVTNERRFLISIDDQLIRGIMDRCVLGWDSDRVIRAEIIDFKTDARPSNIDLATWTAERTAHHAPQLQLYRKVLCRQFSLHQEMVQVTLVLLNEQQIVPILSTM
ncbi:MAG: UvrD-helicase domain-containing protein [Planctomycetota bacterium]